MEFNIHRLIPCGNIIFLEMNFFRMKIKYSPWKLKIL